METYSEKPNLDAIIAMQRRLEQIENYTTFATLSDTELSARTPFAKEYRYLFRLHADLDTLIVYYDQVSSQDIQATLEAARQAEISCNLRFGVVARAHAANANSENTNSSTTGNSGNSNNSGSSSSPAVPAKPAVSTPNSSAPKTQPTPTQPAATTSAASQSTAPAQSNTTSSSPSASASTTAPADNVANPAESTTPESATEPIVAVPATGAADPETHSTFNLPLPFVLLALACVLIGSMIILNRHHAPRSPYHPGRKF